jgi:hypothetical protein
MQYFVEENSIVREIWGKSDTVLFIFAGAAAEFALNKAVDWLYFTGRLPTDPLGRLFSTVTYARRIVFSSEDQAIKAIHAISAIHAGVESNRGGQIPQWAYRDVLYMLIDYSIRSYELLQRPLTPDEKQEVFHVFYRVGEGMQIQSLPSNYNAWLSDRELHLQSDLRYSTYTADLFRQYRIHLGIFRYFLLTEVQKMLCPTFVCGLLGFSRLSIIWPVLKIYILSRFLSLDDFLKSLLLPEKYKKEIKALDIK